MPSAVKKMPKKIFRKLCGMECAKIEANTELIKAGIESSRHSNFTILFFRWITVATIDVGINDDKLRD